MSIRISSTSLTLAAAAALIFSPLQACAENHLAGEESPHLKEHASSLVDWYPWGSAAFEKARSEKKPLFVSIGYHSCHWCHKMLEESFNDPEIAGHLNKNFVNVKVDRAELPEVDRIYMAYIQASQGSGGWPLNVWLTPDLIPFSVGTYFPKKGNSQQPAFKSVIEHITKQWSRFPDYVDKQSRRDLADLRANLQDLPPAAPSATSSGNQQLLAAYERLATKFDPENGGFGSSPRFPNPMMLKTAQLVLLTEKKPDSFRAERSRKMIVLSLDKIAAGGIHDQLDGGFHRYTSDPSWAVPHFEKMLADQALLARAFLGGYEMTGDRAYLEVAEKTIDYVESSLAAPSGGYFHSQHSDSPSADGVETLTEGAYYIWDADQFSTAAGPEAEVMAFRFGVRPEGNSPIGFLANDSRNVLRLDKTIAETAKQFGIEEAEAKTAIARGESALRAVRSQRPSPATNKEIIVATNAMMVSTLARASIVSGDPVYLKRATDTLTFLREKAFNKSDGTLVRAPRSVQKPRPAVAEDYAFTINACLDVYSAGLDQQWLLFADKLQKTQNELFYDTRSGGFYNTTRSRTDIVIRLKSFEDGAELTPNPISILNLVHLGNLLNDEDYLNRARQSVDYFRGGVERTTSIPADLILAEQLLNTPPAQIIIVGKQSDPATQALVAITREFPPHYQLILQMDPSEQNPISARQPKLAAFNQLNGKATAHLCKNFTCKEPTADPAKLRAQLAAQ